MKKVQKILIHAALALGALFFCLGILELGARWYSLAPDLFEYHPLYGSTLRPHAEGIWRKEGYAHVKINAHGLRDRDYPYPKPPGITRILILGDSFTTAFQVELVQTFHKRLEQSLNAAADTMRFEVLNISQPNYGTAEAYLRLIHQGLRYQPDYVVLAFFNGNDFRNNSPELDPAVRPYFILKNGELQLDESYKLENHYQDSRLGYHHPLRHISRWLSRHSHLYRFVYNRLYLLKLNLSEKAAGKGGVNAVPRDLQILRRPLDPVWQRAVAVTGRLILAMRDRTTQHHARFLLASIPMGEQVYPHLREQLRTAYPPAHQWDFAQPEAILGSFCEQNQIDYLSPLNIFRNYALSNESPLYYNFTGHFTPEGHALFANVLFQKFVNDILPPAITERHQAPRPRKSQRVHQTLNP